MNIFFLVLLLSILDFNFNNVMVVLTIHSPQSHITALYYVSLRTILQPKANISLIAAAFSLSQPSQIHILFLLLFTTLPYFADSSNQVLQVLRPDRGRCCL